MESTDDVLRLKLARACTVARQLARVTKMLLHQLDAQEEKKEVDRAAAPVQRVRASRSISPSP